MKTKISKYIISILFILIFIRISYLFLRNKIENKYELKYNDYLIKVEEKYEKSKTDNLDAYNYKILVDNAEYNFQIFDNLYKQEKNIKKIYYYDNSDYKCIYPIFKNKKQYIDIICTDSKEYNYYHNINDKSETLQEFAKNIKEYNENQYDNIKELEEIDNVKITKKFDMFGFMSNYKGFYDLKNKKNVQLFKKDIYNQTLNYFLDKYYIVADYNQTYEFDKLIIVDMTTGKQKEIICYPKISFDSYIQGEVNNELYLYDKKNKKQYKINPNKLSIEEIGNYEKGIKIYKNNEWTIEKSSNCSNNEILFENKYYTNMKDNTYEKIEKLGTELGYYYFYKLEDETYKIYRSTIDNTEDKIYLFETKTINQIKYYKAEVYYIDNDELKKYSDTNGTEVIVSFKELEFNNTIKFGVYKKS